MYDASHRFAPFFQRDPSLSVHHSMVAQAVMSIFKSLGLKSVDFLESILPTMLLVIRYCSSFLEANASFCLSRRETNVDREPFREAP